ncbi:KAP family P-loop NTPase fold protein [Elizabethkingia miricola]|uniref:KAP family P-loop NTPase fold protein n=1 Tax=Elizabethkingia miricola TaxID=172045 RepID=UPI000998EB36|nr:P-loop NTPase fold protein [Elizabethkingia miricola]OPC39385.1 hypothetical protein BAX99_15435 [Elizabethkingia miricola]
MFKVAITKVIPFVNCKLERQQYAEVLTKIVELYSDGFVLAINNEWGTGKTTFVKMWKQHLENNDFKTVYFNAWENDFDSNPLVAIMSELKPLINNKNEEVFKSVISKGAVLAKNVLPAVIKAVAKKYIDVDEVLDAIENTTKGVTEIFEEEIKEYTNKKKSIVDFREELEKFIKETDSSKPLIFIIDELDRCRPDYAVDVLEQMKHFFSVPGIVFVLSIDKNHLASSVRGYYGSENINTDEYLRRFIDLEYSIPLPSNKAFCNYLYEYYAFDEFFSSYERTGYPPFVEDGHSFIKIAEVLFGKSNATLRQQEKIFAHSRLILRTFKTNNYTFSHILFFLIYIKNLNSKLYKDIETKSITLQELSDAFADLMPSMHDDYSLNLIYIQTLLLVFYNNSFEDGRKDKLLKTDAEGKKSTPITSKLVNETNKSVLVNYFDEIYSSRESHRTSLAYLLNKINLTEALKV